MAANLMLGSYSVAGSSLQHAFLIYDSNTDNDNDFTTNNTDVRILRGGAGINHDVPLELSVLVELQDDPSLSVDWVRANTVVNNYISIDSSHWPSMWNFANTMGEEDVLDDHDKLVVLFVAGKIAVIKDKP